jgi:hypothetical protein
LKDLSTKLSDIKIEVFSTLEAAIRFLGIPFENFDLIDYRISELDKNTAWH